MKFVSLHRLDDGTEIIFNTDHIRCVLPTKMSKHTEKVTAIHTNGGVTHVSESFETVKKMLIGDGNDV